MTRKTRWLAVTAAAAIAAATAGSGHAADAGGAAPVSDGTPHYGSWGYDASGEDAKTAPGADFFRFANGAWVDREEIPGDRARYGNFDQLAILSDVRTQKLIETAGAHLNGDPDAARVANAYAAFMDQTRVDKLDAAPLDAELAAIRAERTPADVAKVMGQAPASFQSALFDLDIETDEKAPTRYAAYADTGGLGLPDRDYYLKPEFAAQKDAYQAYIANMLGQVGWPDPQGSAKAILAFETAIAEASWSRAEQRQVDKTYNPMSPAELEAFAPGFDFAAFLKAADLGSVDRVVLQSQSAFPKVAQIFAQTPLDTVKAWQAFHLVDNAAPYLSDRFVQAHFDFHNKTLQGQPEIRPRWKRAVGFVDSALGEAVGRMYVARYFPPEDKAKMEALVAGLRQALAARIQRVDWMSPETKTKALEKLAKFNVKIGYPAKWRDYSALMITADDLYGDAERSGAFEWERRVKRMNGPVDKQEWGMTPQTVNAYYDATNNEVVFPAAILQPPFFDPKADPAVNYGGIGAVIGHEMTHGFDDQGRKSDGDGALHDWWTKEDADKFTVRAARLGAQYSQYEPVPGAHVNGDLTMGENIADLGGVLISLDAYHASLNGRPAPVIGGLTGDQRFFLGFAQIWREKVRDAEAQRLVTVDPHSPPRFRVDGVLRNVDGWYAAFGVKPRDALYLPPDERVRIW
jgi:putative endopeptidase